MQSIETKSVETLLDFDYGEGDVTFSWVDSLGLDASLTIDTEGFCAREMAICSGAGPPEVVEVRRDGVRMRFRSELAKNLELDEDIDFSCDLTDEAVADLLRLKDWFGQLSKQR